MLGRLHGRSHLPRLGCNIPASSRTAVRRPLTVPPSAIGESPTPASDAAAAAMAAGPAASASVAATAQPLSQALPAPGANAASEDAGLAYFKSLIKERRFMCTQCGKCCTGNGEVWVSEAEASNMASHLNLSLPSFYARYTKGYSRITGWRLLRDKGPNKDCVFLGPDNLCRIHAVRPLQCSTYPWWPDLVSNADWQWEKENICEGFDHPEAQPTDLESAARQLRAATQHSAAQRLAAKPPKRAAATKGSSSSSSSSSSSKSRRQRSDQSAELLDRAGAQGGGGSTAAGAGADAAQQAELQDMQALVKSLRQPAAEE